MSGKTKADLEQELGYAIAGNDARDEEIKGLRSRLEAIAAANALTPEARALSDCTNAIRPLAKYSSTSYSTSIGASPRTLDADSRAAITRVLDHLRAVYLGGGAS